MYELTLLLIDRVSRAEFGPGFCILAAFVLLAGLATLCLTTFAIYEKWVEFEKWKLTRHEQERTDTR